MRIALIILIGIHGIIHLFGFFKAFGISQFNAISQPISKTFGIFWLLAFLLFATTAFLKLLQSDYWWCSSFLAIILSQLLIFHYWSDAKFGTLANVIILVATIIGYANYNFKNKIKDERTAMFENSEQVNRSKITEEDIADLPPIVQKWLRNNGTVNKAIISNVHLTQELQLKLKPEQTTWNTGIAEQYFTTYPPAFNWNIHTKMNPFLPVVGRDKFETGKGEMMIKLFSLIPVADAKNDAKINQATLQRYLAEIVWFPSAALNPNIIWEPIDEQSAKATMEYKGTRGSGEFHFDKDGNFEKFVAMRYQNAEAINPTEWTVIATKSEVRNGINIPIACEASWTLEDGEWTWLKLNIADIQYNVKEMPVSKRVDE